MRAYAAEVTQMVTVGTSPLDWSDYRELSKVHARKIHYTVGLHPGYVAGDWKEQTSTIRSFFEQEFSPVAFGEIGLDYFRLPKDDEMAEQVISWQKEAFRRQLAWVGKLGCPVIIHSRCAFKDCVEEIDESGVDWEKVVFHCFTEGVDEIRQLMERGGRASFTGILTFAKNEKLWEAAKLQGVDKLMLETDSPYLSPVPYRGKRNEPCYLPEIGKFASRLLGMPIQRFAEILLENTSHFYGLGKTI